jgi:hypothetical protein
MEMKEITAIAVVVGVLSMSFALVPLALATSSTPGYPFELSGRIEYVVPAGTTILFGSFVQTSVHLAAPQISAAPFVWVPASPYSNSPGHGL